MGAAKAAARQHADFPPLKMLAQHPDQWRR
jgi:hypothetical protein